MNTSQGYSLVEFSIVIMLVGVTFLLAMNGQGYLHRVLTKNDIDRLYITMKYLQQQAKVTHKSQVLQLDRVRQSYFWGHDIHTFSTATKIDILSGVKGPPSDPKDFLVSPITFKENRIEFYIDGTIDAGSIYLLNNKDQQLYALTCGIGGSSYIRIYRYEHPSWHLVVE